MHTATSELFYRDPGDIWLMTGQRNYTDFLQSYETVLNPADLAAAAARVQKAQSSVPQGAAIYESIASAYGFDWNRNPVLIADYPGMASLPPGMPIDCDNDGLRRYFLTQGIHYVMLDRTLIEPVDYFGFRRDPQVHFWWRDMLRLTNQPLPHGYGRMEWSVSNRTRYLLLATASKQTLLYDDGELVVFTLDNSR